MEPYSTWSGPTYLRGSDPPTRKKSHPPIFYEVPAWAAPALPHPRARGGDLGAITGDDGARLSRAAMYQIAKAYAGSRLATAEQAEDASLFQTPATNNTGAYLKAAYWIAVAARIVGSRLLAANAQATVSKGNVLLLAPFSGQFTGSVGSIFRSAAATIREYVGNNEAALSVVARLEALATESVSLEAREEAARKTLSPLDDIIVMREKYGRYALVGGGVVAGLATLWLLSRALARPK